MTTTDPIHAPDTERSLLGCCFLDGTLDVLTDCIAAGITPAHFYSPQHQAIFEGMLALERLGLAPDEITLANKLNEMGKLEVSGGHPYFYTLTDRVPTTVSAPKWRSAIIEKFRLRQLDRLGREAIEKAHSAAPESAQELLADLQEQLFKLAGNGASHVKFEFMDSLMERVGKEFERLEALKGKISGVSSGIPKLDEMLHGFQGGDLIVIAGQPSKGKSAFAIHVATQAALAADAPAVFFTFEVTGLKVGEKITGAHAGINLMHAKQGILGDGEKVNIKESRRKLGKTRMAVCDKGGKNIEEFRAAARSFHRRHGCSIIIVDYFQMMRSFGKFERRGLELAEISGGLKEVAAELNIPVIAIASLNRSNESDERKPRISDVRECGELAYDADVILLLHGDDARDQDGRFAGSFNFPRDLIVGKNRNGPVGEVSILFQVTTQRFFEAPTAITASPRQY